MIFVMMSLNVLFFTPGDSSLTDNGISYGKELSKFIKDNNLADIPVWTSLMKRTVETCSYLPNQSVQR